VQQLSFKRRFIDEIRRPEPNQGKSQNVYDPPSNRGGKKPHVLRSHSHRPMRAAATTKTEPCRPHIPELDVGLHGFCFLGLNHSKWCWTT
jgi:hypothetical protein